MDENASTKSFSKYFGGNHASQQGSNPAAYKQIMR